MSFDGDSDEGNDWEAAYEEGLRRAMITTVSIAVIAVIGTTVTGVVSVTRVKRTSDPARSSVSWLRMTVVLLALSIIMTIVFYGLQLHDLDGGSNAMASSDILMYIGGASGMIETWARAAVIIVLASLSAGMHRVSHGKSKFWQRVVPWAVIPMAIVIAMLALTSFAIGAQVTVLFSSPTDSFDNGMWELMTANRHLSIVVPVVVFSVSLFVAILSFVACKSASGCRPVVGLNVAANVLNLISTGYVAAITIATNGFYVWINYEIGNVMLFVMGAVLLTVVLSLVTFALAKKDGGCWSRGENSERSKDEELVA